MGRERYTFLYLDAMFLAVRLVRRVVRVPVQAVLGVREEGQKVLLALEIAASESTASWTAIVQDLAKRGLAPAKLRGPVPPAPAGGGAPGPHRGPVAAPGVPAPAVGLLPPALGAAGVWRKSPRPGYVADPARGSHHNRGAAVDASLADAHGRPVEMPTLFDAFGPRAHADVTDGISAAALRHRGLLHEAMEAEGFLVNPREWWHFAARDAWGHPLLDVPLEGAAL